MSITCEKACIGCPVLLLDEAQRQSVVEDISKVFEAFGRSLVKALHEQGALDEHVAELCQDTPESLEWKLCEDYDPSLPIRQVDVATVSQAAARIATNNCTENYLPSIYSFTKPGRN